MAILGGISGSHNAFCMHDRLPVKKSSSVVACTRNACTHPDANIFTKVISSWLWAKTASGVLKENLQMSDAVIHRTYAHC